MQTTDSAAISRPIWPRVLPVFNNNVASCRSKKKQHNPPSRMPPLPAAHRMKQKRRCCGALARVFQAARPLRRWWIPVCSIPTASGSTSRGHHGCNISTGRFQHAVAMVATSLGVAASDLPRSSACTAVFEKKISNSNKSSSWRLKQNNYQVPTKLSTNSTKQTHLGEFQWTIIAAKKLVPGKNEPATRGRWSQHPA